MSGNSFFPLRQPCGGPFYCVPLSKEHKSVIKTFVSSHPNGKRLEIYLKKHALSDMDKEVARSFLVFEDPGYLCGFFTLKAGLFPIEAKGKLFYTLPGIDLVYFAKNGAYIGEKGTDIGSIMFFDFILPIVRETKKYIGASHLYIYAIHASHLQKKYKDKYGFSYPPTVVKDFIESHIKPDYDEDCDFMFIHFGKAALPSKKSSAKPKKKRNLN